jgi:hypothetical protein
MSTAYLTNPSEASFRTFLTELSFRHHLTRLNAQSNVPWTDPDILAHDDSSENGVIEFANQSRPLGIGLGISTRKSLTSSGTRSGSNSTAYIHPAIDHHQPASANGNGSIVGGERRFQFSSKASISLRTPTHVYRSFGLLTVAVVSPLTPVPPMTGPGLLGNVGSASSHVEAHGAHQLQSTNGNALSTIPGKENPGTFNPLPLAGTWYYGIFGTWFTGGRVVQKRVPAHSPSSGTFTSSQASPSGNLSSSNGGGKKHRSRTSRLTANIGETVANLAIGSAGAGVGGITTLSLRSRKGEEVGVIVPNRGARFGLIKFEGDDEENAEGACLIRLFIQLYLSLERFE